MINRYFSPPPLSSPIKGEGKSGEDSREKVLDFWMIGVIIPRWRLHASNNHCISHNDWF